ncbi:MAG: hypothetical protein EOO61_17485, partial [Hymenobacter sp.]
MFSIIICTRDEVALAAVSDSVALTICVPYEIISIDNSKGQYSICEAYNIGAAQAKYELLCFMHEDIRFHTKGWGQLVADILCDHTIGVLGVTGGRYQVAAPAAWWGCGLELCRENVLNVFPDGHKEMDLRNPENQSLADVAVVDGLWMCSRREVWQHYPFDSQTFTDFHFYDVDYCTEIFLHGLRVCVTFELLIEHHSRGSVNTSWLHNALKYEQKRQGQLPFGPAQVPGAQGRRLEVVAMQEFIGRLLRAGFSSRLVLGYLRRCLALDPVNRNTLWLLKQWLRSMLLKNKQKALPARLLHPARQPQHGGARRYQDRPGHKFHASTLFASVATWPQLPVALAQLRSMGAQVQERPHYSAKLTTRLVRRVQQTLWVKTLEKNLAEFKPDVICISQGGNFDIADMPSLRNYLLTSGIPYCLICHNYDASRLPSAHIRKAAVNAYSGARKVYFVSKEQAHVSLRQLAHAFSNVEVVKNPVNIEKPLLLPWSQTTPVQWAMVGGLHIDFKGQDILLEVLGKAEWQARDWHLTIYGEGYDREYIEDLLKLYNLSSRVTLHGYTT